MDFTVIFLVILMLLAVQAGIPLLALGLFIIALVTSKNKFLIAASLLGGGIAALYYLNLGGVTSLVVGAGLFLVFIIIATQDSGPGPSAYGGGYPPGY
jgi:hypothetical protein